MTSRWTVVRSVVGAVAMLMVLAGLGVMGYLAGYGTRPACACGPCDAPAYTMRNTRDGKGAVICADTEAVLWIDGKGVTRVTGACP